MSTVLWGVALLLIVIGAFGTVLPALPGVAFVFGGILLAAWTDDFTRISGWTVVALGVLAVIAFVVDYLAAAAGARKAGASRLAIVGAALGTIAGVFTGLIGLVFLPLAGAALGEFVARRDLLRAGKAGFATWLGLVVGTAVKVAIVFTMIGTFVTALIV